jgi:TonB-linked SusC/RagA family outer membrane protein
MNIKIPFEFKLNMRLIMGLLLFISVTTAWSQDSFKVSGKVIGEDSNEGLPGVTVFVKGTTNGTVTDLDGKYTFTTKDRDAVIAYSFVGFKTQEIAMNGRTTIDVTLMLDVEALDEVVIVGYGEVKKANLTGAITTVKPSELEDLPVSNLAMGLVGKLAGVQVRLGGTGIPGTATALVIRDESSSGTARQVLYVIDGIIYSDETWQSGPSGSEIFNRLDPTEIESISILKDGAAAVYGARGAGGVILVKTKRGKEGKLKFSYNGSIGIGQATQIPKMLSGEQHAEMWNEILDIKKSLGSRPSANDYFDDEEMAEIRKRNYNWLDGLYKSAITDRHSMNVSGGSKDVRYFLSGSYYKETGNYENLWYKRYSVRSNMEYDMSANLMVGFGLSFSQGERMNPNYDPGSGDTGSGVLRDWYKRPLTAAKWIPPTYNGQPVSNSTWNPYGLLQSNNFKTSSNNNTNINAKLDYKVPFLTGLKLSSMLSYNIDNEVSNDFNQDYETYNYYTEQGKFISETPAKVLVSNSEGIRESYSKGNNYQYNFSANYAKSIGQHNINATMVYEQANGSSRGFNVQKYISDIRGLDYLWAFSNNGVLANGDYSASGRWGVVGRLSYDYKGKYIFESSFRRESTNKFAPSQRKGTYPSASVGWALSDESFFKDNIDAINFFKLRFSAGLVGNDNVRPFEWKPAFTANENGPIFGVGEGSLTNAVKARGDGFIVPSRTWSKTRSYNLGFDMSAFSSRLSLSAEYYYAYTYDAFQSNNQAPFVLGAEKPPAENYKQSYSEGYEVQLGYKGKVGKDFNFSIDGNFTRRHSRPLKLYQNSNVVGTWADELLNDDSNQPGYIALGIIRTDEDLAKVQAMYPTIPSNGQNIPVAKGMIYYKDVGGPNYSNVPDGKLDGNDIRIIAQYTTAPYSYGFGLGMSYKAWKIQGNFGGAFGHKVFTGKDEQLVDRNAGLVVTPTRNTFDWWGDYWTVDNPNSEFPRPSNYGLDGQISTFWMRNGHTLRLNNLSLSYQMPKNIATKLHMSNLRFYTSATNVWTIISPYKYKDPAVSQAFDYPLVRTISIGLSFSI